MKKTLLIAVGILLCGIQIHAQIAVEWQIAPGGSKNENDASILPTDDGGYMAVGHTYSNDGDVQENHGKNDVWVVRFDQYGSLLWDKCFGGTGSEWVQSFTKTTNNHYLIAAVAYTLNGDVACNLEGKADVWVFEINDSGDLISQNCYGGSKNDYVKKIRSLPDSSFILGADTESIDGDVSGTPDNQTDIWLVKIKNGEILWEKTYGGERRDHLTSVYPTHDNGFIIGGYSYSNDTNFIGNHAFEDGMVIKVDSTGGIEWKKGIGGSGDDFLYEVKPMQDGGYLAVGNTDSYDFDVSGFHGGHSDAWVVKLNSFGEIEWQKCLGGTDADDAKASLPDGQGGYLIAGSTNSSDGDVVGHQGNWDGWLVNLGHDGSIQWQLCIGDDSVEFLDMELTETSDGGYITGGNITQDPDMFGQNYDYWIVKLSGITSIPSEAQLDDLLSVFPNPAHERLYIRPDHPEPQSKLWILDILGRVVTLNEHPDQKTPVDISNLAPGTYWAILQTGSGEVYRKLWLKQ